MTQEVSIIIQPHQEKDSQYILQQVLRSLREKNIPCTKEDVTLVFLKKSIDARHGKQKFVMRYRAYIGEKPEDSLNSVPEWKHADGSKTVVIIGSGPAGLFGAFKLLEKGVKPVVIERGQENHTRKRDIASISTKGIVGENSNYCFGEGGAGTFSDGKLYTRSNKRGNINDVLKIFNHFGADEKILTDAHPHIGTDKLPSIIQAMREKIILLGGEVHFNTKCTDFITDGNIVKGIRTEDTITGEEKTFTGDAVLLATGHSANDIYNLMAKTSPESLEAKTFAVGVRVEHPRQLIDFIQYHGKKHDNMGAAEYRVVTQQDGRGVYSFCMCPGGFVVPSSSGPDELVVNGMSSAKRNSQWSNAAIVVETRPEDIPLQFAEEAKKSGCPQLAGLFWRTWLEQETFRNGNGQQAPSQRLTDFLKHRDTKDFPRTSYTPGIVPSRLDQWLPPQISRRLESAFHDINKEMRGFITEDAILIASETRTSTPVRIVRDKESGECISLKKLYPAGEGSGYAGGIVSSAMDGINQCQKILDSIL